MLMLTVLGLSIISCKKDKKNVPESSGTTQPNYVYVCKPGSYWVYDLYGIDSLGNEILLPGKDSIVIAGDTLIHGDFYHKYVGFSQWYPPVHFERDSLGYIVDENGTILYSFNNVVSDISSMTDGQYLVVNRLGLNEDVATNFGVKNAFVKYREVSMNDGSPVTICGDLSVKYYQYYVSGIGLVQDETEEYLEMTYNCSKKRRKLSFYYIAP